jgi:hypothetical protein
MAENKDRKSIEDFSDEEFGEFLRENTKFEMDEESSQKCLANILAALNKESN